MSVNTSRNRNILEGLFKELLDMRDRVPEDGHISIARFRDIEHVTQFNFNELDSAEVNLALVPPVLFEPMDWASLKQHPVDPELAREFFDIGQDDECDFPMEPVDRVRQVSTLIEDRTTHEARSKQNLQTVHGIARRLSTKYKARAFEPGLISGQGLSQLVNGQFGITPALLTRAKNLLQMIPSYQLYLQNIGGNNWADPALGPFGPVLRLQAEIRAGWAKGGGKQTDEDTVNAAFIELLSALTSLVPTTDSWWRTTKRRLTFTGLRNGYVAITDGQFEVKATEEIRTPIECKGREREKLNARITMQEVAELVAWVKEYPDARISPPVRFRPLAGQCGQEIFLESLEYGQDWIKYIRQGQKAGNSFANLHSYGPYDMNKVSDMRLLAPVIVAMSY
ncbi:hypothetical protein CBS147345_10683 [Aspergillus niger]|nr:hypothetical protein CBS147345_10683 [Aspergillus niger]